MWVLELEHASSSIAGQTSSDLVAPALGIYEPVISRMQT